MPRRRPKVDWSKAPRLDAPIDRWDRPLSTSCYGGPDAPGHSSARCCVVSWCPPKQLWYVCGCACHDVDLEDRAWLDEILEDKIEADRPHREMYGF